MMLRWRLICSANGGSNNMKKKLTVVAAVVTALVQDYQLPNSYCWFLSTTTAFGLFHHPPLQQHRRRHYSSRSSSSTTSFRFQTTFLDNDDTTTRHARDDESVVDLLLPTATNSTRSSPTDAALITVLEESDHYMVVNKPFGVVCHHSEWTGSSRSSTSRRRTAARQRDRTDGDSDNEDALHALPMLQRVRDQIGRRVNLVHRLDRGASGCLLLTYTENDNGDDNNGNATRLLSDALARNSTTKTYVALVRGEGILHGRDFKTDGWFVVDRPIKNERGIEKNATTWFRFVAGQDNASGTAPDRARASLVLARPVTGRWHQVRKHLNGLSHPILGDSTHGNSRVNRAWREQRGLPNERTCLHLSRLQIREPIPNICPHGIDVTCPLAPDMMRLLQNELGPVLETAAPILEEEGIVL